MNQEPAETSDGRTSPICLAIVALAGLVGLALMAHAALVSSATYDEVAYLRIASDWWLKGASSEMTRMGSPVTFFKLQQAPALVVLTVNGLRRVVADPMSHLTTILPAARLGALWVWAAAFVITVTWSRKVYGPRAMALAACLFALSPNLVAHGSILTMEMPLIAATVAMFALFWTFLETGRRRPGVLVQVHDRPDPSDPRPDLAGGSSESGRTGPGRGRGRDDGLCGNPAGGGPRPDRVRVPPAE
jgi:hypothetical protein